jgi:hypothetical protein
MRAQLELPSFEAGYVTSALSTKDSFSFAAKLLREIQIL